jgi:hypothetical protein
MKSNALLYVVSLWVMFFSLNCTTQNDYHFSLKNTLSIFLLNNDNSYYFAIPIQYIGDYHVENFEFDNGYILLGDYKITLKRDDLSIDVFINESSDEYGNTNGLGNLNQYNIFLKYIFKNNDMDNIINEYKKGNTHSQFYLGYAITIDNERMTGCGYTDDFELSNDPVEDYHWLPPNLALFRSKVLKK